MVEKQLLRDQQRVVFAYCAARTEYWPLYGGKARGIVHCDRNESTELDTVFVLQILESVVTYRQVSGLSIATQNKGQSHGTGLDHQFWPRLQRRTWCLSCDL